jgi:hypothetical protein
MTIAKEKRDKIIAALTDNPNSAEVARRGNWNQSTVWVIAKAAGIELTAGNAAKGRRGPLRRAEIVAAFKKNPRATLRQVARQIGGVSHETVRTIAKAEGIKLAAPGRPRRSQHLVGRAIAAKAAIVA